MDKGFDALIAESRSFASVTAGHDLMGFWLRWMQSMTLPIESLVAISAIYLFTHLHLGSWLGKSCAHFVRLSLGKNSWSNRAVAPYL